MNYTDLKAKINAAKRKYIVIRAIERLRTKDLKKLSKEGYCVDFITNTTLEPFNPKPFYCKISWN